MADPWNIVFVVIVAVVVGASTGILIAHRRAARRAHNAAPADAARGRHSWPASEQSATAVASRVVYSDSEVRETARRAGLSEDMTSTVVEAHYDYLERNVPEGGTVVHEALVHTIAAQTGVDRDQVGRILEANLEWLREQGLAQDAGPV